MRGRVNARKVRSVLEAGRALGFEADQWAAQRGLSPALLNEPDGLLPQDLWRDAWGALVDFTGQPAVGLRTAAAIPRGYYGVLDYVLRTQPTIGAAVRAAVRFFPLANTQGRIAKRTEGDFLVVTRHIRGDERGELPLQAAEFALVSMVRTLRLAAAESWVPAEIRFRHGPTSHAAETERYFRSPVRYECSEDAIVVNQRVLAIATRTPEPELLAIVTQHAEEALARVNPTDDFEAQLRDAVCRDLEGGPAGIDEVARHLGTSRRTLQRRLRQRDLVFRDVQREVRAELADRLLERSRMSIGEVAWVTGFASISGFSRAYRRWRGVTPSAYRSAGSLR